MLDGGLHLGLGGVAVAGEGLFDLGRAEFDEGQARAASGEEDDPAGVGHDHGGSGVFDVGEDHLDGEEVGFEALDEFGEIGVEFKETVGDRGLGIEAEDAGVDEGEAGPVGGHRFDAAEAGDACAGIDAQDSHGVRCRL